MLRRLLRSTDEFLERGALCRTPGVSRWRCCSRMAQPCLQRAAAAAPLLPPPLECSSARCSCSLRATPPPAAKHGPFGEGSRLLFQFKTAEDLARWNPFSDAELGGCSTAALAPADEPQVGALQGRPGAAALLHDGTCPS